jgi:hypothetical protein
MCPTVSCARWTCLPSIIADPNSRNWGSRSSKAARLKNPVVIYPSSGTGAWEAAIVNTLSPRDKVLMVETGHFATLWKGLAA